MADLPRAPVGIEPAEHDAVEGVGGFDVREMPHAGDLLVAGTGNEAGKTTVLARRSIDVILAADGQHGQFHRGQPGHEIDVWSFFRLRSTCSWAMGKDPGSSLFCLR